MQLFAGSTRSPLPLRMQVQPQHCQVQFWKHLSKLVKPLAGQCLPDLWCSSIAVVNSHQRVLLYCIHQLTSMLLGIVQARLNLQALRASQWTTRVV